MKRMNSILHDVLPSYRGPLVGLQAERVDEDQTVSASFSENPVRRRDGIYWPFNPGCDSPPSVAANYYLRN